LFSHSFLPLPALVSLAILLALVPFGDPITALTLGLPPLAMATFCYLVRPY